MTSELQAYRAWLLDHLFSRQLLCSLNCLNQYDLALAVPCLNPKTENPFQP